MFWEMTKRWNKMDKVYTNHKNCQRDKEREKDRVSGLAAQSAAGGGGDHVDSVDVPVKYEVNAANRSLQSYQKTEQCCFSLW